MNIIQLIDNSLTKSTTERYVAHIELLSSHRTPTSHRLIVYKWPYEFTLKLLPVTENGGGAYGDYVDLTDYNFTKNDFGIFRNFGGIGLDGIESILIKVEDQMKEPIWPEWWEWIDQYNKNPPPPWIIKKRAEHYVYTRKN